MKNIFLTSSNADVTSDLVKHIPNFRPGMKLAFIPTAAEVEKGDTSWLSDDRQALVDAGFSVTDFSVRGKTLEEVKNALDPMDAILMSGGNTYFLLQELQHSHCMSYLRDRVARGMIYIGTSAGSIVAGPTIKLTWGLDDPAQSPKLADERGLGVVDIIVFPHWGSESFSSEYRNTIMDAYTKGNKIILLTDDQYVWVNDEWCKIISV